MVQKEKEHMKRKVISLLLALVATVMVALPVYAENTTTLTTTVPEAAYTLKIPADQTIEFGATLTEIGNVTVTNSSGFAVGKNLEVTVTYSEFTANSVSTKIPFVLKPYYRTTLSASSRVYITGFGSGSKLTFKGLTSTQVSGQADTSSLQNAFTDIEGIALSISSKNWGKALAGTYTATITFTAEVVVEN